MLEMPWEFVRMLPNSSYKQSIDIWSLSLKIFLWIILGPEFNSDLYLLNSFL